MAHKKAVGTEKLKMGDFHPFVKHILKEK